MLNTAWLTSAFNQRSDSISGLESKPSYFEIFLLTIDRRDTGSKVAAKRFVRLRSATRMYLMTPIRDKIPSKNRETPYL